MDLSIIVINYNSKNYLRRCIDSILLNTYGIDYEIIVVDSASFDGSGEMLRQFYPEIRFIQSQYNAGFAAANNLGVSYARGTVILFLNPDTEMREPAILKLYKKLQIVPDVGLVGVRLLNSDGSLQTSCVQLFPTVLNQIFDVEVLKRWFPQSGFRMTTAMFENGRHSVEVEALSGACLMIHRAVFDQLGGFSTDYFMYGEDIDLCYKARQAGLKNYYVPQAELIHHGGGSSKQTRNSFSDVMMRESISRFLRKTRGNRYKTCYRMALTGAAALRLILLAIFYPLWHMRCGFSEWSAAVWKWIAIMRWGLGLENWLQQYEHFENEVAERNSGKENPCAGSAES